QYRMDERKVMREGLSSFLNGLKGKKLLVEMRGEKYANGVLEDCDCFLNLRMKDVSILQGTETISLRSFFIRGKFVRFVHMEDYADIVASVRKGIR
ncbi:hypothetical protein PMAYCL1PPCAC_23861, partial [Pristionchus mayeri]